MPHDDIKSFHDLVREVQAAGRCGLCGGCVSFCSAGDLHALRFGRGGMPEWADEEQCLKCGICYLVCPQIRALGDELKKKHEWKAPIGSVRALRSARTASRKVAAAATDGGVVTSLLLFALEKGWIDGAVVARHEGPFSRSPALALTAKDILAAAGTHYDEVPHLGAVGGSYTSFVPAIREVGQLKRRGLERVAFVGTPCQVYSLRKMQLLGVVPSDAIALVIGLFCMENFSLVPEARRKLERTLGLKLDDVVKVNVKDDVRLTTSKGDVLNVPFELVDDVARPACFFCGDFSNEYADLSCGGLGSPDGYTTVVVRSAAGERLYNGARQKGAIRELPAKGKDKALLQRSAAMAKLVSFTRRKQARAARACEA